MIEKTIKDYLKKRLNVPSYMEEPETPEEKYIIVEKTGSSLEDYIHSAMIAVKSYGKSMFEAAELNEEVKKTILEMAELNEICKVSLNSDYPFADTSKKKYRYQAVFDIKHY